MMNKLSVLVLCVLVCLVCPLDKCCLNCSSPNPSIIKTYSIDNIFHHCGESCIDGNKFWLYKIFEAGLKKADNNT